MCTIKWFQISVNILMPQLIKLVQNYYEEIFLIFYHLRLSSFEFLGNKITRFNNELHIAKYCYNNAGIQKHLLSESLFWNIRLKFCFACLFKCK